jgi:ribosome biogenesis GTPase
MVLSVDRGRFGVLLNDNSTVLTSMRARELGRSAIAVGDQVEVVGHLSGAADTLSRIVRVADGETVLRRTADHNDPYERVIVANTDQLLIVTALAHPPPDTASSIAAWSRRSRPAWNRSCC